MTLKHDNKYNSFADYKKGVLTGTSWASQDIPCSIRNYGNWNSADLKLQGLEEVGKEIVLLEMTSGQGAPDTDVTTNHSLDGSESQEQRHKFSKTKARSRFGDLKRTASVPRSNAAHEPVNERSIRAKCNSLSAGGQASTTKQQRHTSIGSGIHGNVSTFGRTRSLSLQRLVQRTSSVCRAQTSGFSSDQRRWPGSGNGASLHVIPAGRSAKPGKSATDGLGMRSRANIMTSSIGCDDTCSALNTCYTLQTDRNQKAVVNGHKSSIAAYALEGSSSSSCISQTSRAVLISKHNIGGIDRKVQHCTTTKKLPIRTRIYHEASVQTTMTSIDLEKMLTCPFTTFRPICRADQQDQNTQTDLHAYEIDRLRNEVWRLTERERELGTKLECERAEKFSMQRELNLNMKRAMHMFELTHIIGGVQNTEYLGNSISECDGRQESLLMLESQIHIGGHELCERQLEVGELQQLCRSLQLRLQRSISTQHCLLQEKITIEQESAELQDFLQNEKNTMCDAFAELEVEYQRCKHQLACRDAEISVLRDECRHLVRLNEQRRQETRLLLTKYTALDVTFRECMLEQHRTAANASNGLDEMRNRLDGLVEQLMSSYNISDMDLEDFSFQKEGQAPPLANDIDRLEFSANVASQRKRREQSINSERCQPEKVYKDLSPQRNQSFIAAVICAIRNGTIMSNKRPPIGDALSGVGRKTSCKDNDTNNNDSRNNEAAICNDAGTPELTEMIDSETEPFLIMDNVLDIMPDSHSHNMISTTALSECSCTDEFVLQNEILLNKRSASESLCNLSKVIANRKVAELQMNELQKSTWHQLNDSSSSKSIARCQESESELPLIMECKTKVLVDQVVDVDCLVTKLLKLLHLIQLDNNQCIQQLIFDKNKLQGNQEDMLEKLKIIEDINMKLQDEVMDATQDCVMKSFALANSET